MISAILFVGLGLLGLAAFASMAFKIARYVVTSEDRLTVCVTDRFVCQGRSSSAYSFHASLLQAIDGVMSLALCPQVVSRAPQHFRSSGTQATCDGCQLAVRCAV